MDRVELHFHLLPGVDDGPRDLPGALALARATVADGTRLVTCTPHAHQVDFAEIPDRVRRMQVALDAAGIDLQVRGGAELMWDDVPGLDDDALDRVAQGPSDRRWLLLEAPLPGTGPLAAFEASARELRERGFGLLIGHPERSSELMAARAGVDRLLAAGDRLQVNASSLTGYHGGGPRAHGLELVRSGRATVLASDAHQPVERGPVLGQAVAVLRRHGIAPHDAERLVSAGPRALLEGGIAPARRLAA
ncbi:MAG TPA: CpsB/CapC family capsule biosynthesis tyrosine phosphatase [Solirubrobacteraceae bacterium]